MVTKLTGAHEVLEMAQYFLFPIKDPPNVSFSTKKKSPVMKSITSLVALLSLASVSLASVSVSALQSGKSMPSACQVSERVVIESHNVTVSGKTIQVSQVACSADALVSRSLEKRQVLNACDGSSVNLECVTEAGVAGPLTADCEALATIIADSGELADFFEVAPGFAEIFSSGTCEWAWINSNAVGGPTLEYCLENILLLGEDLIPCTEELDSIGGFAQPTDFALVTTDTWTFEIILA
ncbi:hypothetical protein BDP27DRAFT_1417001 [Rhodocollybia butyracea]|uniref:Uncharacterized protein n=1 Tax=Rhodocollybia butyracea TaxID=206335 RepID=A0A9P5Q2H6_9AGAR|nr:hypothetical protein BDP27DRAFT_1417001 [Rhodocollybia butyracea]